MSRVGFDFPPVRCSPLRAYRLFLKAPAKINWFFQILGRRPDGFHNIASLMQSISLYDEIILAHSDSLTVETNMKIPARENIVYKVASLLRDCVSYRNGVHITLRKYTPAGSGLGGGSSDAAGTLLAMNDLAGKPLNQVDLHRLASRLGADVPFFLSREPAVGRGPSNMFSSRAC